MSKKQKKDELKKVIAEKEQPQDVVLNDEELIAASGGRYTVHGSNPIEQAVNNKRGGQ